MEADRHRAHRRGRWGAIAALTVAAGGFVLIVMSIVVVGHDKSLSIGDWTSALSVVLAYAVAATPLASRAVKSVRTPTAATEVLPLLRRLVRTQWSAEAAARQLRQPRPVRLRWQPTARPVQGGPAASEYEGHLVQDLDDHRPAAAALTEAFDRSPGRPLVILGEPGAGKTSLVVLFVLAAVESQPSDGYVPVVLSASAWNPARPALTWAAHRIGFEYPQLDRAGEELTDALAERRVIPVIDGLDEMPAAWRAEALKRLDEAVGVGAWFVLTCRSAEFEQVVGEAGALSRAAVVEIEPIAVEDAAIYLTERETTSSRRWEPVLDAMRAAPDGPLAEALSTPLMIGLARRVYQRSSSRPEELTEFDSATAIQTHLLTQFLPALYPDAHERADVERWLAFLAHHSRDRLRDPDLEWWWLARALPRPLLTAAVALTVLPPTALGLGLLVYFPITSYDTTRSLLIDAVLGLSATALTTAVVLGRRAAATAHAPVAAPRRRFVPAVLTGFLRDCGTAALSLAAVLLVVAIVLLGLLVAAPSAAGYLLAWPSRVWDGGDGADVMAGWVVGFSAVLLLMNVLSAARRSVVRSRGPRLRDLAPSLAVGLSVGLMLGAAVLAVSLLFGDYEFNALMIVELILVGTVVGLPVGLARWLTSAPDEGDATASPEQLVRTERRWLLVAALVVAAYLGLTVWLLSGDRPTAAGIALSAATLVVFGSGSPWPPYLVARLWLAASGRLPWRLMRFLRQAYAAGVLRSAGSAYQFRHDLLRNYLADAWTPRKSARSGPP
ncbi:NACHT domain-containing protein [Cryptosporangium aurantiacum]|nr:NACHT domain-containing protein [Cryptosporangium aurantiacum]